MLQQVACVQQKGNTDKNMYATRIDMGIEPIPGQQQQVILQTVHQGPFEITVAKSRSFIGMGATQITLGVACILFNIIGQCLDVDHLVTVPGILVGISIVLTGRFGVVAGQKRQSKGFIIAFMVMSIINTVLIWYIVFFASTIDLWLDFEDADTGIVISVPLIICGLVEFVIAIVSAAICCRAVCCNTAGYVRFDAPCAPPGAYQAMAAPPYSVLSAPPGAYQAQAAPPYESHQLSVPVTKQAVEQNLGYQPNTPPPEYSAGQPEHI